MRPSFSITASRTRRRTGISLVEVIVSLTMLGVVMGIALPFFLTVNRAVGAQSGRMDAQLNINFALDALDRDLRVAGVGIVSRQPLIVLAASDAITFNGDLASRLSTDFATVYYDPDAPPNTVGLLWPANRITLPNQTWTYPDSAYWASAGVPSHAETISYWVEPDTQAAGFYRVMRRANDAAPRVLARGIKKITGEPFFRYFKLTPVGALAEISQGTLPMRHLNGYHGAPADTGVSALVDSIRLVRFKFTSAHHDPRVAQDAKRVEERSVRITNAGLINAKTCGTDPLSASGVAAVVTATPSVLVTWIQSTDEGAGEKDVERYAIYRRAVGAPVFGEPFASVAAGTAPYSFTDTDVKPGEQWVYGVSAQDCTPASSSIAVSGPVVIP
jgi:type II secretory pathway pseudopilin PulG